jgi:hypothetical protein
MWSTVSVQNDCALEYLNPDNNYGNMLDPRTVRPLTNIPLVVNEPRIVRVAPSVPNVPAAVRSQPPPYEAPVYNAQEFVDNVFNVPPLVATFQCRSW